MQELLQLVHNKYWWQIVQRLVRRNVANTYLANWRIVGILVYVLLTKLTPYLLDYAMLVDLAHGKSLDLGIK